MTERMAQALLGWYEKNKRDLPWRGGQDAYRTWVSEIMLQQTRAEAVKGYFIRFVEALPSIKDLAGVDDDRLMKLWEGLGYYSRARNLKRAAQVVVREHGGALPSPPEELLKLPGIGLYTAGAIASIAYGVPVPAVDGNVLRVCARLDADFTDIALDRTKRDVSARLLRVIPQDRPGDFNQALMELGACVCLPNGLPNCGGCPLVDDCLAHAQSMTAALPVKSPKKPRRIEERQLLILRCGDRLALRRRPPKGLLAGLWELPEEMHIEQNLIVSDEDAGTAVHIFTHIEWHMSARKITVSAAPEVDGLVWVTQEELMRDYALPSAFAGFRDKMF